MNSLSVEFDVHFRQRGRGARQTIQAGPKPAPMRPGRVPRIARLMALAIRFDQLLRDGVVDSQAELASLGYVSRARISQILNLLNLASDIQEEILFLPRTLQGHDPIHLRQLQPIAITVDWRRQRAMWQGLTAVAYPRPQ